MPFLHIYLIAFAAILVCITVMWLWSIPIRNVSIIDGFWGTGFAICAGIYYYLTPTDDWRKILVTAMAVVWGLRLSIYLAWRNHGKGEDFRYQQFRKDYGEHRYWWFSFFQVFLLQGVLMWLISAPLLGAQLGAAAHPIGILDIAGIVIWCIGFAFEAGGDYQLTRFKANPANKGKVLNTGFWRYTRHPNYFGDAAVWWGFGLLSAANGAYWPILGSLLLTALIIKVSGVAMLERTLKETKPQYKEYIAKTSAFLPWPPKT